mgnify:CR=1 FL=1
MAFKQQYKGLSRASDGKGFTLSELEEKTKKEKIKSKEQALKLPQIEKPGFDYEMDQDMSYPGGERGRDYDEEGTKYSMSRKASPLNDKKSRLEKKGKKLYDKASESGSFNQEAYDNNEGIKFDNPKAQRQYQRGSKAFKKAKKL